MDLEACSPSCNLQRSMIAVGCHGMQAAWHAVPTSPWDWPLPTNELPMKLAIMQPYLFPYLGYFQLVRRVDRFVFYDDVNYINRGWVNRNRLSISGRTAWFTFPLSGASQHQKINEVQIQPDGAWRRKLLASVRHSYAKAPYFEQAYVLLADMVESPEPSLSIIARESVVTVARYLGLDTEFVCSTGRYGNEALRGPERVLDICRREGATEYHNLPGGTAMYSPEPFAAAGVALRFVQPELPAYRQSRLPFQPGLSILDVLMFNDRATTLRLLADPNPVPGTNPT